MARRSSGGDGCGEAGELVSPAAEWLLDNHHIVDDGFRHLLRDLSPTFFAKLPLRSVRAGSPAPDAMAIGWTYVPLTAGELAVSSLSDTERAVAAGGAAGIGEALFGNRRSEFERAVATARRRESGSSSIGGWGGSASSRRA